VAQSFRDLERGEFALAEHESDLARRLEPAEPRGELAQAAVFAQRTERDRAERMLEHLSTAPDVPDLVRARASLYRGELLLDANRVHDALACAESLDREHPLASVAKNLLGLARGATGDREGARLAFESAATLDPTSATARVNLARLARESGDLPRARAELERALAIEHESAEAWLAYGIVLVELRANTARHALVRAAELAPDDAAPWIAQGNLDLLESNVQGAIESFRNALARDPNDASAQTNLGVALARAGDRASAAQAFERATRVAPHQGEAWNGLGAMRLAQGDAAGALGPLEQASVLLAGDPNPPMNLGRALERLDRWDEAARAYREVLRRVPGHTAARDHLLLLSHQTATPRAHRG
jgi:tetratricopeptide (TPR) repeat protein